MCEFLVISKLLNQIRLKSSRKYAFWNSWVIWISRKKKINNQRKNKLDLDLYSNKSIRKIIDKSKLCARNEQLIIFDSSQWNNESHAKHIVGVLNITKTILIQFLHVDQPYSTYIFDLPRLLKYLNKSLLRR